MRNRGQNQKLQDEIWLMGWVGLEMGTGFEIKNGMAIDFPENPTELSKQNISELRLEGNSTTKMEISALT